MSFFSVIVPCYNAEEYLSHCIHSVLEQEFKDYEIVLVNDFSTDSSGEICDELAAEFDSVRVVHLAENGGVSLSRNTGIKASRGKYIVFLDSDDYLAENCLGKIASFLKQKPTTDVLVGRFTVEPDTSTEFCYDNLYNRDGVVDHETDDVIGCVKNLESFARICWCYIINAEFLREKDLYFIEQARIFEDTEFVTRMLCLSGKVSFFDELFYHHRRRPGSLGQSIGPKDSLSGIAVVTAMCKLLRRNRDFRPRGREFIYGALKDVLNVFIPCMFIHDRKELHELGSVILEDLESFESLEEISEGLDLYFFLKTFGARAGLALYKAYITEKTVSMSIESEGVAFYIFCAGIFGEGIARILTNEGYQVKGFLDNNDNLQGSVLFGLEVESPDVLGSLPRDELAKSSVIICNQSRNNIDAISLQLQGLGLKSSQIAYSDALGIT